MPEENEVSLYDYIKVISKRKWLIVIGTFVCILTAATVTLFLPRVYETRATLTMEGPDTPDVKIGALTIPTGLSLDKFFNSLPHNRDLNLEVIRKLGLDKSPDELTPQALNQMITFSLAKDSRTITINARYSHPEKARDIADTMAEVMKEKYQVLNEAEIAQSQALIDEQLNLAQTRLLEVEKDFQALKETVDVDSLGKEIETRFSKEAKLLEEYSKVRMSLVEQEACLTKAEEELQKQDKFYLLSKSIVGDPTYKGILDKLSKDDIALLQKVKSESQQVNPIYIDLKKTVTNVRISIAGTKAKERLLKEKVEENRLTLTEGAVKLLAAAKTRQLKTVGRAPTPTSPIEPKTKRILLIAAVVGLLAVVFLAFFLEYLEKMRKLEAESKKQNE